MKILVIGHADNRAENFIEPIKKIGETVVIWRADKTRRPNEKNDAIIITGGPMNALELATSKKSFFPSEIKFIKQAIKGNIPILGVCLGHQLLAHLLGGKLGIAQNWQIGWQEQILTPEGRQNSLFYKLPRQIINFEFHQDKVVRIPSNAKILAASRNCKIESFGINNKPIWGIQFHPEISAQIAEKILTKEQKRLKNEGIDMEKEIKNGYARHSPNILSQILTNFSALIKRRIKNLDT